MSTNSWIQKNTYKPLEQVKHEHPVFLPNKGQQLTLSWIPNPQQSWLSDLRWGPCMVPLLSTAGVQTPGLTVVPLGERRCSEASPLGAPRKGEQKGGRLKNPEGGSYEENRPSHTMFTELYSSKGHSDHCQALKKDAGGGRRMKPAPVRKLSVTIP